MAADPPTTPASPGDGTDAAPATGEQRAGAPAGSSASPPVVEHTHRVLVRVLLAVGLVVGLLAIFSVWINRQVLSTSNWTNTSSRLIADPRIDQAVGTYLVGQLFSAVDVAGELQGILPKQIAGLAGPAAGGLRQLADQVAPQLLASATVQSAWRQANTVAHRELLTILNGGGRTVSTQGGEVALNLRTIIDQLAAQLGFSSQVAAARAKLAGGTGNQIRTAAQQQLGITLPPNSGQLVILRSNQLKTAQDVAEAIRGLALWLTVLAIALFVAAVWLAHGWRRVALRSVGWCFVAVGILVLLARRVVGDQVIGGLVASPSNRPAALAAWTIGTSLLYDIAVAIVVYGLVIVVAAWLAGGTRAAVGLRRALAPDLRDHPVAVYSWLGGAYLLILLWGPTPAFRQLAWIVLMVVLLVLGVQVLRRQAAEEFPDAHRGDASRRLRAWAAERRSHVGRSPGAAAGAGGQPVSGAADARLAALERLSSLHERGVITDAEFVTEKQLIMNGR
jgi:hypothetical protein